MAAMVMHLLLLTFIGSATAVNPKQSNAVAKVIDMLGDLKAKVAAEGVEENKTYAKFDRFCSETKAEKQLKIKTGYDNKAVLEASIASGKVDQETLQNNINGFKASIADLQKTLEKAIEDRKAAQKVYADANVETEKALKSIDNAVDALKASKVATESKAASFLQVSDEADAESVRSAMTLAAAFSDQSDNTPSDQAPVQDYGYHAGDVISTLENLQVNFRQAKKDADDAEGRAVAASAQTQISLKAQITSNERKVAAAQEAKAASEAKVGQSSKDLESQKAQIADDERYSKELTTLCAEKKQTFDQRKSARAEEIIALTQAIQIIKDSTAPTNRTAPKALLFEVAAQAAVSPAVLISAEADAEAVEESEGTLPESFFQRSQVRFLGKSRQSHAHRSLQFVKDRAALIQYLTERAQGLHSYQLAVLAQTAESSSAADIFAEIKKTIVGMIDNLQTQAAQAQDHKGSCDKRILESSTKRDDANKKMEGLNSEVVQGQARRDKLLEDIDLLSKDIAFIDTQVKNASKAREEESKENAADIEEAQFALSGLDGAMAVIKTFYGKSKQNAVNTSAKVSLLEEEASPASDAPDASSKNKEAYKGSQDASTGIIGMLEVIQSDFQRTITETKANEEKAKKEHDKFLGETKVAKAGKTKAKETNDQFLKETKEKLDQDLSSMGTQLTVLKGSLKELAALDKECGVGVTFEERAAARAREIDALKEAIQMMDGFLVAGAA